MNLKMSDSVESNCSTPHTPELDYDMWEGQFEFVGPSTQLIQPPQGLLKPAPHLPASTNGVRKNAAHEWCDGITDQGSLLQFQLLQQQVGYLQDSANHNDERYTRAKADNAALQARVIMLEEQLRDAEMRSEDRLQDEQRRSKEIMLRVEREKQLQLENANIRLQSAETESTSLRQEVNRQRIRIERLETERREFCDQIQDLKNELLTAKESESILKEQEKRLMHDQQAHTHLIKDLSHEVERLRSETRTPALPTTSPETLRLEELHQEMTSLRDKNIQLQEANEELQASLLTAGVEQGRLLTAGETSLAAELEAMTHDQNDMLHDHESLAKIQQALKEQQDVNIQLRAYIDGILLNIVENYPQLLEVKRKPV